MAKEIKCPLCSNNVENIEKINVRDIINLWKKRGIDTEKLFEENLYLYKNLCPHCKLEFFYPFVPGDNKFYSLLGREEWYYLHEDKTEFLYSCKFIKENDHVLDVGSGRGAFLKYIDKKVEYTGLELSSQAVEFAKKEKINVMEKTIEEFAQNNQNTQDVVVTFQVLEHIVSLDSFIKSSLTALKKNGYFIIAVPNNYSFIRYTQNNILNLPPHHLFHWNEYALEYIAKKYNLEIVDIYKDKVTNVHKTWFYTTKISKFIRGLLGVGTKTINVSFLSRVIQKISFLLSKFMRNSCSHLREDGHTIAIVFRKIHDV